MYTVTFTDVNGNEQISRYFETIRAARTWTKWLFSQKWQRQVSIYRGQAGEMLLERKAA